MSRLSLRALSVAAIAAAGVLALGLSLSWGQGPGRPAHSATPRLEAAALRLALRMPLRTQRSLQVPGPSIQGYSCPVAAGAALAALAGAAVCSKQPCSEFVGAGSVATTMLMQVNGPVARARVTHSCGTPGPVVALPVSGSR